MKEKYDFNLSANTYDNYYLSDFGRQVDEIEKQCVTEFLENISPDGQTLEIGCGTGHWTEFFVDFGFKITAIDIAEKMLEKAKLKNLKNVTFNRASVLNLPYKDEYFDNIFAVTSLEFTENQQKAFDEIFRVLKYDGNLLIAGLLQDSELHKNRENSDTFRTAEFFSVEKLNILLSKFGVPEIKTCLKIDNGKIIDNQSYKDENALFNDTFFVAFVKKNTNFY